MDLERKFILEFMFNSANNVLSMMGEICLGPEVYFSEAEEWGSQS